MKFSRFALERVGYSEMFGSLVFYSLNRSFQTEHLVDTHFVRSVGQIGCFFLFWGGCVHITTLQYSLLN